jgi:hypothetical protein
MLWFIQPQNIYQILTGEDMKAPMDPVLFPMYNEAGSTMQNTIIQIQWQKNKELFDMLANTDMAIIQVA